MRTKRIIKIISIILICMVVLLSVQSLVKPAQAVTTVLSNTSNLWGDNRSNVFFNGSNYFVVYDKGSTTLFARGASTVAGLSSASEQTLLTTSDSTIWNMVVGSDSKIHIAYSGTATTVRVKTCSISGITFNCSAAPSAAVTKLSGVGYTVTYNAFSDRIWLVVRTSNTDQSVLSANQTGDAVNITGWTTEGSIATGGSSNRTISAYGQSDKVLLVYANNTGTAATTGFFSIVCTRSSACTSSSTIIAGSTTYASAGISISARKSDTDFRFVFVDTGVTPNIIKEYQWNASSWSFVESIDSVGGQTSPTVKYDRIAGNMYLFYADNASPARIQQYTKPSGGTWGSKTQVDGGESTANSRPAMNVYEPPEGSTRQTPRELFFGYRTANGTNFDLKVDSTNLATPPTKVVFTNTPRSINENVCNGEVDVLTMQLQNASNVATTPNGSTVIRVSSSSSNYTIYSDSNCSDPVTNGDFTFSTSEHTKSIYIIDTVPGTWTLTAAKQSGPDTLANGTQSISVAAVPTPTPTSTPTPTPTPTPTLTPTPRVEIKGGTSIRGGTKL